MLLHSKVITTLEMSTYISFFMGDRHLQTIRDIFIEILSDTLRYERRYFHLLFVYWTCVQGTGISFLFPC